jgi:DNA-binding CsgD family transcriptional regulator
MARAELDKAVGAIYEASLGEECWDTALSGLGTAFSSGVYLLIWNTVERKQLFSATSNLISEEAVVDYENYYGSIDPRRKLALDLPVNEILACHEHFDANFVSSDEFYNDFLHRYNFRYAAACRLLEVGGETVVLGLQRSLQHGPFETWERGLLCAALPDLSRAFRLRHALNRAQDHAARRQAMLDRFQAAALLVDASGRVLEHNAPAEDVVRAGDGLLLRCGRLGARRSDETARLLHLVKDAADAASRQGAGGGACHLSRADGSYYPVLVTPLRAETGRGCRGTPAALVLILDLGAHRRPPEGSLRALYGLTAAEQTLAIGLLRGQRPKEIADQRGVSLETIRIQLKALFAKTDCNRQVDLVRRLASLAFLLR